ncbi:hypothetical protein VNO78_24124 [Psophocarpus tetragonolobus]|uniref:Uncharacterized protein n=1 Tax=Psophocarpus tetragonolobus TaxID=3891 RepID=A0AAN9S584_PSOTE
MKNLEMDEKEKRKLVGEVWRMKEVEKKMIDRVQALEKFVGELKITRGIGERAGRELSEREISRYKVASLTTKVGEQKLEIAAKFVEGFTAVEALIKVLFSKCQPKPNGVFQGGGGWEDHGQRRGGGHGKENDV